MSGPKGASYTVVSEAERRRRAVAAARNRLESALARLNELQAQAGSDAVRVGLAPRAVAGDDVAAIEARIKAVAEHCDRLEVVVKERRIAAATREMAASLEGFTLDFIATSSSITTAAAPTENVAARRGALVATLDNLARHVSELPDSERPEFVDRLRRVRSTLDELDQPRAAQAVSALRGAVAEALHREAARASFERRRLDLAQEFADVTASEPALLTSIERAVDDVALAQVRTRLAAGRERLDRAADQRFVLTQAADALRMLGYRVEVAEGDGTDALVACKDDWRHHGLRLLFPQGQAAFSSTPEAYGDTDARDDLAFEQASCRDVDALLDKLQQAGVRTRLRVHHAPGTVRVRRAAASGARRRRTASSPAERAL